MRILFLGSPEEVEIPLRYIVENGHEHGHELVGVVTPPAKPFGRKLVLKDPPIASISKHIGLNLHQTANVNCSESLAWIQSLDADIAITAAFGQILSQQFLNLPRRAVINIHPSLLPLYRGATPVQSALLDQKTSTGVTILFTVKALDAGGIILQKPTDIQIEENAPALTKRLFSIGAEILFPALSMLKDPHFKGIEQDPHQVTHCKKVLKSDGLIEWNSSTNEILARFRAYYGWPGSYTFYQDKRIKIVEIKMPESTSTMTHPHSLKTSHQSKPGQFYYCPHSKCLEVITMNGSVMIRKLQPEGSQPMEAGAFWNGIKNKDTPLFFKQNYSS